MKQLVMPDKLITFSGRFQPFGPHHYRAYKHLWKKFGICYITTSNKIEYPDSPFSFVEKKFIMTEMFSIGEAVIWNVSRPYNAMSMVREEYHNKPFITALSEKDADRLTHSSYFQMYSEDIELLPMSEAGYIYILPEFKYKESEMNGTILRNGFAFERFKRKLFKDIYGEFNEDVFKLITSRLSFMKLMKEEHRK